MEDAAGGTRRARVRQTRSGRLLKQRYEPVGDSEPALLQSEGLWRRRRASA
jgi:hypothetical protein